jgi:hypothetical protein
VTNPQMRPRSFGEILDGAFQIYRRHAVILALTTLIPSAAMALTTILVVAPNPASPLGALAVFPVTLVAMVILYGALSWQTSEAWLGGPVTVADGFRAGGRSFFRLLGTLILMMLMFYVALIPVIIVAAVGMGIAAAGAGAAGPAAGGAAAVVMAVIIFAGMVFAGILMGGWMACAIPVVVVEGVGPLRAIGRSFELVRGSVLRSGLLVVVAGLIVMLPVLGIMLITGQFALMLNPGTPPTTSAIVIQQLGGLATSAFTLPFLLAVITVLYYDRRVRSEALDVQLATHDLPGAPAESVPL